MQIKQGLQRALAAALLTGVVWAAGSHGAQSESVNINTADADALSATLVGVGVTRAEAIIAYREANGGFVTVEELANVTGIGMATVDRNAERIRISDD